MSTENPLATPAPGAAPGCHKLDTPSQVFFYEQDFYVLSNFSSFSIMWEWTPREGLVRFDTSESVYHFMKFRAGIPTAEQWDLMREIRTAPSAHEAFKLAERNKHLRRPDWDDVKVGIMRDILRAKVEQHEYARRKLLASGDRELIEDSWRDDFWGWGPNRDGQNMLGKLWMEIRAELRALAPTPPPASDKHAFKGWPADVDPEWLERVKRGDPTCSMYIPGWEPPVRPASDGPGPIIRDPAKIREIARGKSPCDPACPELDELFKRAQAAFAAMTPEQQAEQREAQRSSWMRGEMGLGPENGLPSSATIYESSLDKDGKPDCMSFHVVGRIVDGVFQPESDKPSPSAIADALEACEWPDIPIGNKAVLRAAIASLRAFDPGLLPPAEDRSEEERAARIAEINLGDYARALLAERRRATIAETALAPLRAEVERLRGFTQHTNCAKTFGHDCTCGLDATLATNAGGGSDA